MLTEVEGQQRHNGQSAEQRCHRLLSNLCQEHHLNSLHVGTYLGHLTNNTPTLIEELVASSKTLQVEQSESFDPRDLQGEYLFCLLSGKAALRRMVVESDGRETCASKSSVKELSSLMSLYNYRTHQNNQFYVLDCEAHSKLLMMTVPNNLTHKTYAKNAHKLSFLTPFFASKQVGVKNTLHTHVGLFHKSIYVKGSYLTRHHTAVHKVRIIVDGICSYSVMLTSHEKGKEVPLFTRGPKSIIGAELLLSGSTEFGSLAAYTVCVESAHAELYEIDYAQLTRLPKPFLEAFGQSCAEQYSQLERISASTVSKEQSCLLQTEQKAVEDREAIHSKLQFGSSPTLKKEDLDDQLYSMMCTRVKEDRNAQLQKKIAMNLNEITRVRSSGERITDFQELLDQKINQKRQVLKAAAVDQEIHIIEEQFEEQIATVFDEQRTDNEDLMTKTQIKKYHNLLAQKNNIVEQQLDDSAPLMLLKEESKVDSKSFKLKMLRRGFQREDYEQYLRKTHREKPAAAPYNPRAVNILTRMPIEEKIDRIKQKFIQKINITNRIKDQCVVIRAGFAYEEPIELDVIRGYKSMKELELNNASRTRKSSVSSHRDDDSDYGLLLRMLQRTQKREESLEQIHQKARFLKRRTLTPYNHSGHLKQSARLHRYSVTSMRKHRADHP